MNASRAKVAGITAMAGLAALAIMWAALTSNLRTVKLTDEGAAISTSDQHIAWPDMRIDVNAASAAELAMLPGLGPSLAERIVAYRQAHGPFASLDDLMRVKGIGPAILERLRKFAVAQQPVAQPQPQAQPTGD